MGGCQAHFSCTDEIPPFLQIRKRCRSCNAKYLHNYYKCKDPASGVVTVTWYEKELNQIHYIKIQADKYASTGFLHWVHWEQYFHKSGASTVTDSYNCTLAALAPAALGNDRYLDKRGDAVREGWYLWRVLVRRTATNRQVVLR